MQGGVAPVEVAAGVEVVGHFQTGFFKRDKGGAVGQQFGFERAPPPASAWVVPGRALS